MFDKIVHRLEEKQDELHSTMLLILKELKQVTKLLTAIQEGQNNGNVRSKHKS